MTPFWKTPAFRTGISDVAPVCFGLSAWGLMTGVAMVKSGMSIGPVLLMSVIVFAGSSQLAALPLMASGAPLWVILATSFCVNLRFVVFSIHLRAYVMHQPLWRRLLSGYLMADMGYVLLVRRHPEPPTDAAGIKSLEAYWLGNGGACWASWVGSSLVGVALGSRVPVSWGLSFAGILALLGVMASLVSTPLRVVSAAIAAGAAIVAIALPLRLNILVAIVSAVLVCMLVERSTSMRSARSTARMNYDANER
jgi:predicted branched-subunit amino acid permease